MSLLFSLLLMQVDPIMRDKVIEAFRQLDQFEVQFTQTLYSPFFEESQTSGFLQIARPGRMRMEMRDGDHKTIIWDGETCYEYDRLADSHSRTPQAEVVGEPMVQLLLYGSDLAKLFLIDRYKNGEQDVFRLRPRNDEPYQIEVIFDEQWRPQQVEVMGDEEEGSRFVFSNYRLQAKFSPQTFSIPAPKPTEQP